MRYRRLTEAALDDNLITNLDVTPAVKGPTDDKIAESFADMARLSADYIFDQLNDESLTRKILNLEPVETTMDVMKESVDK